MESFKKIAQPRPVGTIKNQEITDYIDSNLKVCGYETTQVPFECKVWETEESFIIVNNRRFTISVNPYSEGFQGKRSVCIVRNLEELEQVECKDRILFLTDELSKEELQPKDYPFYYPEEHKAVIDLLEKKQPVAIIGVTVGTCMSGLSPYPILEDGNFHIPIASIDIKTYDEFRNELEENDIQLSLISSNKTVTAHQLIASKRVQNAKGTIVVCAHMDSKYHTNAALDNASGAATMLEAAKKLESDQYNIDIVPFNTEEHYNPQGELLYLGRLQEAGDQVSLLINIDTIAHIGSKIAVATFNYSEEKQKELNQMMESSSNLVPGEQWYEGDHAAFAFGGTKCIVMFASDLMEACVPVTHCMADTTDLVDEKLIKEGADFICKVVNEMN